MAEGLVGMGSEAADKKVVQEVVNTRDPHGGQVKTEEISRNELLTTQAQMLTEKLYPWQGP